MEYNVLNNGELVLSSHPQYIPESIPKRQKVVLLPLTYQAAGAPEPQYQNFQQAPFQSFQKAPYQSFSEMPYRSLEDAPFQTISSSYPVQARTLQAQYISDAPYQNFPSRNLQTSNQVQSLLEAPSLQGPSQSTLQAQCLPAPVNQSMFSTNSPFTDNVAYTGSGISVQDMRQFEESFNIDMAAPVAEAAEEIATSTIAPSLAETPSGTVHRSCADCDNSMEEYRRSVDELSSSYRKSIDELSSYKRSIEELLSSQKKLSEKIDNIGRAWSRFAEDVTSDMDENQQWRISIEEKIEQLLEGSTIEQTVSCSD